MIRHWSDTSHRPGIPESLRYAATPVEWNREEENNMQEIVGGLWIGPFTCATEQNYKQLLSIGIKHIVCVCAPNEANFIKPQFSDSSFKYLRLEIADEETEGIIKHFPTVRDFIDSALSQNNGVLIHDRSGNTTSAALVLAYLMETLYLSYEEAIDFVQKRRPCIQINEGFKMQLREYEPMYRAKKFSEANGACSTQTRSKRKSEELESFGPTPVQPPPSPAPELDGVDYRVSQSENMQELSLELQLLRLYEQRVNEKKRKLGCRRLFLAEKHNFQPSHLHELTQNV